MSPQWTHPLFILILSHVHIEAVGTANTFHGVVSLFSGQAQNGLAVRAFLEHVGLSVPKHGASELEKADDPPLDLQKLIVFRHTHVDLL